MSTGKEVTEIDDEDGGVWVRFDRSQYGRELALGTYPHEFFGGIELAPKGNIVFRVGQVNDDETWTQTAHVVLTPEEFKTMCQEVSVLQGHRAADDTR